MQDGTGFADIDTVLFDLARDPRQASPMRDEGVERRLRAGIRAELEAHDAPAEFLARYGTTSFSILSRGKSSRCRAWSFGNWPESGS
jgi:hypothetical protein